jgi:antitoxin VapB
MALQIDAPETISLIERISKLTGESEETTVEVALRERFERLRASEEEDERWARVQELVDSLARRFRESKVPYIDHGELLYGEDGLPR